MQHSALAVGRVLFLVIVLVVLIVLSMLWALGIIGGSVSPTGSVTPCWLRGKCRRTADVPQSSEFFKHKKVLICGLLRDSEDQVQFLRDSVTSPSNGETPSVLASLTSLFGDWRLLVGENDSSDDTRGRLLAWAAVDDRVRVLGCGVNATTCKLNMPPTISHGPGIKRIEKMTYLRNLLLEYANQPEFKDFDYLVMTDLDLKGYVYLDGLWNTAYHFETDPSVDAVSAWGYALTPICWGALTMRNFQDPYAHKASTDELENNEATHSLTFPLRNFFAYGDKPVTVVSSFGGLTFYRLRSVLGLRYINEVNTHGQARCEHVTLHRQLKMMMNPTMIHCVTSNPGNGLANIGGLFKK
jgi:hypothetical protein